MIPLPISVRSGFAQKVHNLIRKITGCQYFQEHSLFYLWRSIFGEEKRSSWDTWHISTLLWSFGFHELLWPQILTAKLISSLISEGHFFGSYSWDSCNFSTLSMQTWDLSKNLHDRIFSQKFYTLKVRKLQLFLLKKKQRKRINISYFSSSL